MKRAAAFLLLILSPTLNAGPADECLRNALYVEGEHCVGSAVAIKHKGQVYYLTAAHVVADNCEPRTLPFVDMFGRTHNIPDPRPRPMRCRGRDGAMHDAAIVWYSASWKDGGPDLALLKPARDYNLPGAELLAGEPELGETAWFCGSGGAIPFVLEKTIVSLVDDRFLSVNGCGWYGHSGSGVFVERKGKLYLAGIVCHFMQHPGDNPRVPVECERQLRKFLDTYPGEK